VLTDAQWERIAVFMPSADVVKSPPVHDRRQAVGTVIYRLGCGCRRRLKTDPLATVEN